MKYTTRTTQIMILPEGEPIFSDQGTSVTIRDDAAGEYLVIGQIRDDFEKGEIRLTQEEYLPVCSAISFMMGEIKRYEKAVE